MWTQFIAFLFGSLLSGLAVWLFFRFYKNKKTETYCGHLTDSAKNVEKFSLALKQSAKSVVEISNSQAESIRSLNDSTQNLATELNNISENSSKSDKLSSESLEAVVDGERSLIQLVEELKHVSNETSDAKNDILNGLEKLSAASQVIKNINQQTSALSDIVFQAKLLSFNASVEAARAGEAGRGFSVVADEIGVMARSSGSVAEGIEKVLKDGLAEVERILDTSKSRTEQVLEKVLQKLEHSTQMSIESSRIFTKVALSSRMNQGQAHEVANAVKIANSNIRTIASTLATNVLQLDEVRGKVQNAHVQSESLGKEVETLNQVISDLIFEVTGEKINDLTVDEVRAKIDSFRIVDVRRPDEFNDELGHVTNAQLFTLDDDFESKIRNLDKNAPTLFICRSGGRSSRACRIARAAGFKNISNMQGGMLAWAASKKVA